MNPHELSLTAGRNVECESHFGSLPGFYRTKHILTYDPANAHLYGLCKELKIHVYTKPHVDVYSSFICTCQTLEATTCPSGGEWIKNCHFQTIQCYLVLKKKKEKAILACLDMEETSTLITKYKKLIWKANHTHCRMPALLRSGKKQNYANRNISGCHRVVNVQGGGRGWGGQ